MTNVQASRMHQLSDYSFASFRSGARVDHGEINRSPQIGSTNYDRKSRSEIFVALYDVFNGR